MAKDMCQCITAFVSKKRSSFETYQSYVVVFRSSPPVWSQNKNVDALACLRRSVLFLRNAPALNSAQTIFAGSAVLQHCNDDDDEGDDYTPPPMMVMTDGERTKIIVHFFGFLSTLHQTHCGSTWSYDFVKWFVTF